MRFSVVPKSFNPITTPFLIWLWVVKSNVMVMPVIIPLLVVELSAIVIITQVVTIVKDVCRCIIISHGPGPPQNMLKPAKSATVMD